MLFLAQLFCTAAAKPSVILCIVQPLAIRAQTDFLQMRFHRLQAEHSGWPCRTCTRDIGWHRSAHSRWMHPELCCSAVGSPRSHLHHLSIPVGSHHVDQAHTHPYGTTKTSAKCEISSFFTLNTKRAPPCNPNPIYSNLRQFPEPRCVNADHLPLLPANTSNRLRLNSLLWPCSPSPNSGTSEKAQRCQLAAFCHVVLIKRGDLRTSNGSFCSISLSGSVFLFSFLYSNHQRFTLTEQQRQCRTSHCRAVDNQSC